MIYFSFARTVVGAGTLVALESILRECGAKPGTLYATVTRALTTEINPAAAAPAGCTKVAGTAGYCPSTGSPTLAKPLASAGGFLFLTAPTPSTAKLIQAAVGLHIDLSSSDWQPLPN